MIQLLSVEPETQEYDWRVLRRVVHGDLSGSVRSLQKVETVNCRRSLVMQRRFFLNSGLFSSDHFLHLFVIHYSSKVKLFQTIITAVVIGLVNLQVQITGDTIQNIGGVLYTTIRDMNYLFLYPAINVITAELPLFLREHRAQIYSADSYYWAKSVAELPQYTILPIIYALIVYWMTGLYASAGVFFKYLFVCILQAYVAVSIAMFGACVFGEEGAAIPFMPLYVLPMRIFGGFYINYDDVPPYFQWATFLSWFRFGFEALENNNDCTAPVQRRMAQSDAESRYEARRMLFWIDSGILVAMFLIGRIFGLIALKLRTRFAK
ncbi:unnamed protein product, partial [Mesorhabditis belari]|uniref:ABC-2 type transporter transmembrane domain-containing protein n=1 Tax=Mesorhabditis belari TaxID=2138241 RepID=A0AAF3EMJ0_9BILA